ncbi:MAG: hypothetical protein HYU99_02600 [Deltaproteobacteria bacterium]|nr:hypothetical protein [Deltaproteobacteria bacterium]
MPYYSFPILFGLPACRPEYDLNPTEVDEVDSASNPDQETDEPGITPEPDDTGGGAVELPGITKQDILDLCLPPDESFCPIDPNTGQYDELCLDERAKAYDRFQDEVEGKFLNGTAYTFDALYSGQVPLTFLMTRFDGSDDYSPGNDIYFTIGDHSNELDLNGDNINPDLPLISCESNSGSSDEYHLGFSVADTVHPSEFLYMGAIEFMVGAGPDTLALSERTLNDDTDGNWTAFYYCDSEVAQTFTDYRYHDGCIPISAWTTVKERVSAIDDMVLKWIDINGVEYVDNNNVYGSDLIDWYSVVYLE